MNRARSASANCLQVEAQTAHGRHTVAWMFLIVVATLVAYIPAYQAGFIWDDDDYILKNETLRDVGGLLRIWTDVRSIPQWYPMVHTTYWVEYQIWGAQPAGYHVVNVLLHATNALLLMLVLRRLGFAHPAPLIAGAIFALHPVHVESVAWITERKNTLSTFFYLLSALAYLRLDPAEAEIRAGSRSARWWTISFVLFACACSARRLSHHCRRPYWW